ncbi:MAG: hypothetical protein HC803_01980 [Saprospiraceae bacterium]|nr:hypothetical protein [Saprospiraceae bacterium]
MEQAMLFPANDTTVLSDIYAGLAGTYTVGGSSPDFNNFTELATQLNIGGVTSAVTIDVRDGTYNEQFDLIQILGVDSLNQLVFQSESGNSAACILNYTGSGSTNNYIVYLNGTDWVTFRNMTFKNSSLIYQRIFSIYSGATHLVFENNRISNTSMTTTGAHAALMFYSSDVNEYQTYTNNIFENGSYGLYYDGNYNNGNYLKGNSIIGNQFLNQYYYGMYLEYSDAVIIDSNIIRTTFTLYEFFRYSIIQL